MAQGDSNREQGGFIFQARGLDDFGTPSLVRPGGLRPSKRNRRLWQALCCSILAGSLIPASAADGDVGDTATAAEAEGGGAAGATEEAAPERLLTPLSDWRQRMSGKGFDFSAEYLSEVIANVSGGVKRGAIYEGLVKVGLDFDGEKLLGWKGGSVHVSGL